MEQVMVAGEVVYAFPQNDGTTRYQRAPYIEDGWYIVEDGGEFGVYYITFPDWASEDDLFCGVQPTLEEAIALALREDSLYS